MTIESHVFSAFEHVDQDADRASQQSEQGPDQTMSAAAVVLGNEAHGDRLK